MWRKLRQWSFAPARTTRAQIPRALVASVFAAGLDFAVLVLVVEQARWHPVPAAVLAYLIGGVLQYMLCAAWVFPAAPANLASGYLGFLALSLVGLGITGVTIAVLHDFAHVNYALAKIVALGFSFPEQIRASNIAATGATRRCVKQRPVGRQSCDGFATEWQRVWMGTSPARTARRIGSSWIRKSTLRPSGTSSTHS